MAQIVIQTTRFPLLADISSGYTLAFVINLIQTNPHTTYSLLDSYLQIVQVGIFGGLLSSFFFVVDPVNKFVRRFFLDRLLDKHRQTGYKWFFDVLKRWETKLHSQSQLQDDSRDRAKAAYYAPYLARIKAQISGGSVFLGTMFLFAFWVITLGSQTGFSSLIGPILILLGGVALYSLFRDINWRLPEQCWTVGVYDLLIEIEGEEKIKPLRIIEKHLSDANWFEARAWLFHELLHSAPPAQPRFES